MREKWLWYFWLSRHLRCVLLSLDVVMILTRDKHRSNMSDIFRRCRVGGSLHIAAMRGDVALVRKLLREHAQVWQCVFLFLKSVCVRKTFLMFTLSQADEKDEHNLTPLHHAARNGRFLVVDELLTFMLQNHPERLQQLLLELTPDGRNALHLACSKDSVSCAIVMLSRKKGDLLAAARNGDTALHVAARNGQVYVTALLLMGGADVNYRNLQGDTPAEVAAHHGNRACLELLAATPAQLHELARELAKPPPFPWESRQEILPDSLFDWRDLGSILSRMWHCTHSACTVLRAFRPDVRRR